MPPLGGPCRNIAMMFGMERRVVWLPDDKKKFEDRITRFDRIHKRHRQMDGNTLHDGVGRACIALHVRNGIPVCSLVDAVVSHC